MVASLKTDARIKDPSARALQMFYDADAIRNVLARLGFQTVIAGGFARDLFFGVEPKDLDIIVFNHENNDYGYELEPIICLGRWEKVGEVESIFGNVPRMSKVAGPLRIEDPLFTNGKWCAMYGEKDSEKAMMDRVSGVYQLEHRHIDIIQYDECPTEWHVTSAFDFNLNQFKLSWNPLVAAYIPTYAGNTDLRSLTPIREDASDARCMKVANKFLALHDRIHEAYKMGILG